MRSRELVLEDWPHEAFVEQPGGAVDDVQRLGLRVVRADTACGTEDRTGW